MRVALWIARVGAAVTACGGDAADAPDLTTTVGAALPQCGLRASTRTDGACEPVGPVAPNGEVGFTWGADGWGLQATYATNCARDERRVTHVGAPALDGPGPLWPGHPVTRKKYAK